MGSLHPVCLPPQVGEEGVLGDSRGACPGLAMTLCWISLPPSLPTSTALIPSSVGFVVSGAYTSPGLPRQVNSGHHDNGGGGRIGKQEGFKKDLTLLLHIFRKSNKALMKSQDTYSQGVEEILRAPSPTLHPSPDFPHSPSDGDWIGQRLHPMLSPPSCCLRTDSNAREDHK